MSPLQPIEFKDMAKVIWNVEDYSINISVKIPNETEKIVNFQLSHYKSMEHMENKSRHSNQSFISTGIKTKVMYRLMS